MTPALKTFVSPSPVGILVTVSSKRFATQTAPLPTATPLGPFPTGMPVPTLFVDGLILRTRRSSFVVTQTAPSPKAMPLGVLSSGNVCVTRFASGSMREIVPSPAATQTEPTPTVIAPGSDPTSTCSLMWFDFASINPAESESMRASACEPPVNRTRAPATNPATTTPATASIETRRRYHG